ncbi:MAG: type II toxin-antitoxin system VapC family toxin [Ignavibacteria bacterium]|nr:type II toxin-antitoxin system VapC family toxin [Ignavibacteria bacterium]
MKPKVYIETSIPSFYFETRTNAEAIARRNWTHEWWNNERRNYDVWTSPAVLDELRRGNYDPIKKSDCLDLLSNTALLRIEADIALIVDTYIRHKVMPANAGGDALHLAIASWHKCDILLTWNCKHIANANKTPHIRQINTLLGLYTPQLITPLELLGIEP